MILGIWKNLGIHPGYKLYHTDYTVRLYQTIWLVDNVWYKTCKVNDDPIYRSSSSSESMYRNYYTRQVLFHRIPIWCILSYHNRLTSSTWRAFWSDTIGMNAFDFQCPGENQSNSTCKSRTIRSTKKCARTSVFQITVIGLIFLVRFSLYFLSFWQSWLRFVLFLSWFVLVVRLAVSIWFMNHFSDCRCVDTIYVDGLANWSYSKIIERYCDKKSEPQIIEIPAQQTVQMVPQQQYPNININNHVLQYNTNTYRYEVAAAGGEVCRNVDDLKTEVMSYKASEVD